MTVVLLRALGTMHVLWALWGFGRIAGGVTDALRDSLLVPSVATSWVVGAFFYAFAGLAGLMLLVGDASAVPLARAVQAAQVVGFQAGPLAFWFSVQPSLSLDLLPRPDLHGAVGPSFRVSLAGPSAGFGLSVDLLALLLLALLLRHRPTPPG